MDGENVSQGIVVTILLIPLITVGHIILAAAGAIFAFFIIRSLFKNLGGTFAKFGSKVKKEAQRLEATHKQTQY